MAEDLMKGPILDLLRKIKLSEIPEAIEAFTAFQTHVSAPNWPSETWWQEAIDLLIVAVDEAS